MPTVRVQLGPFSMADELAHLLGGNTAVGGIGAFIGTVRGTAAGQPILSMTLEHYPGMTERALSTIADQAASRWNLLGCTVIHRIGRLLPGDQIVLVLTASPHRHDALDATAFLIDWLKTHATFWKQEQLATGTSRWVDARTTDTTAAARWGALQPAQPGTERVKMC